MIDSSFRDLIEQRRLVILNTFLSTNAYRAALSALDVVCTPYRPSVACRAPCSKVSPQVAQYWPTGAAGWKPSSIASISDGHAMSWITRHLRTRFASPWIRSAEYRETDAITRLLAFHSIENFAAIWTNGIRQHRGLAASNILPWGWVEESIQNPLNA
jgi:hypothetical protein